MSYLSHDHGQKFQHRAPDEKNKKVAVPTQQHLRLGTWKTWQSPTSWDWWHLGWEKGRIWRLFLEETSTVYISLWITSTTCEKESIIKISCLKLTFWRFWLEQYGQIIHHQSKLESLPIKPGMLHGLLRCEPQYGLTRDHNSCGGTEAFLEQFVQLQTLQTWRIWIISVQSQTLEKNESSWCSIFDPNFGQIWNLYQISCGFQIGQDCLVWVHRYQPPGSMVGALVWIHRAAASKRPDGDNDGDRFCLFSLH